MEKLCIIMMGLPARGKSTLAKRLHEGLSAEGFATRIFNNGDLRRSRLGEESSVPEFYHPDNSEGRSKREQIARINAGAAKAWLRTDGAIAIIDATNVSRSRREMLEEEFSELPILYIECVADDPELLSISVQRKTRLPEFAQMTREEALASFTTRMEYYALIHTPLKEENCFVRVDSFRNEILDERLAHDVPHYLRIRDLLISDWVRDLFLVRHGESLCNVEGRIGGDASLTERGRAQVEHLAAHFHGTHIPYIFSSRRRRSLETASPLAALHPEATHILLDELDEIDAGVCDGMRYEDIRREMPEEFFARAKDKYHYCYPEGEGYASMRGRVERGFRKALFLSGGLPGTVLIGHQAVNRMILSLLLFRRAQDVPYIYVPQDQYFHIVATHRKKLFELVPFTDKGIP